MVRSDFQLTGGGPFSPRVRLLGAMGSPEVRERAARRLEAFVAAEASRRLSPLRRLKAAIAEGRIKGLARGLAYQLVEQCGVLDRQRVETEVRALSQDERRALKSLGLRFGAFSLFLPALLRPEAKAFCAAFAELALPSWRPATDALSPLPDPAPPPAALAYRGLRQVGGLAAPVEALEQLDALVRAAPQEAGGALLAPDALAPLGWSAAQTDQILRALGFAPARKAAPGAATLWRRRRPRTAGTPPAGPAASPFAALAALAAPEPAAAPKRRPRRTKHRRRPPASAAS